MILSTLSPPFYITLIGMLLVFLAIAILWLLMVILVKLSNALSTRAKPDLSHQAERKRKAAIAAVVVAPAREDESSLHEFPLPPTALVSAWQAVMRTNIIKKRGQVR